ncbi:MAG TPA: DAK2 domain-containing protein [Rubrobacter sp.]|nr:DAK2 domain-containing protein [Rubrobacter sp.]
MAVKVASLGAAAHAALKAQVARINALNVYPVPDGDTGTNMLLTLESTLKDAAEAEYAGPEEASRAVARAALMGARGNSGVILSQMIRGACDVLAEHGSLDAAAFAAAMDGARERAYASVREPVEGTMLTVIKDAARAAVEAVEGGEEDLPAVIRASAVEAHESVRRTPELLDVLRDAGVVDAGGLAVAVILDGIYACVTGEEIESTFESDDEAPDLTAIHAEEEAWGYCTQFVVSGFAGEAEEFEEHVYASGKSVLVIADEDTVNVHVHTQDPGAMLSYACGYGRLARVKIEDMEAQVRSRAGAGEERAPGSVGVVAASRGVGNRSLFEEMGAVVVEGGQGANPSAADLAGAVEEAGSPVVVILPNNKNIVPTAERVGELVGTEVRVVPTRSIAAGLAVMVGFDAEGEPEEVAGEMEEILASLHSAEVTRSVRDTKLEGRDVPEGSFIGFIDDELVAAGETVEEVALALAGEIVGRGADVLTLVGGEDLDPDGLERMAEAMRALDEDLEVETREGGQPLYPLQMVAE